MISVRHLSSSFFQDPKTSVCVCFDFEGGRPCVMPFLQSSLTTQTFQEVGPHPIPCNPPPPSRSSTEHSHAFHKKTEIFTSLPPLKRSKCHRDLNKISFGWGLGEAPPHPPPGGLYRWWGCWCMDYMWAPSIGLLAHSDARTQQPAADRCMQGMAASNPQTFHSLNLLGSHACVFASALVQMVDVVPVFHSHA